MTDIRRVIREEGLTIGIPDLEREVWDRMPEKFRYMYELVWLRAFGNSVGGRAGGVEPNPVVGTKRVTRTSTSQVETRGGAHSGKKLAGASSKDVVSSTAALEHLRRVDRRLRTIAREMATFMGGEHRDSQRRCSVCGRIGEAEWVYCPNDGKPMMNVDRVVGR